VLITLVPLSIEVRARYQPVAARVWFYYSPLFDSVCHPSAQLLREEQTNEVVKELVSKGFSYNQIQGMGYQVTQPQSTLSGTEGATQ
jgi:hypothetical protein